MALELLVQQSLGRLDVLDPGETVAILEVLNALRLQLPLEPWVIPWAWAIWRARRSLFTPLLVR